MVRRCARADDRRRRTNDILNGRRTLCRYGHDVSINTLGIETHATAFFFEDDAIRKNVLGRRGWLDRLIIAIADHDQTLYLSPHGESAVA